VPCPTARFCGRHSPQVHSLKQLARDWGELPFVGRAFQTLPPSTPHPSWTSTYTFSRLRTSASGPKMSKQPLSDPASSPSADCHQPHLFVFLSAPFCFASTRVDPLFCVCIHRRARSSAFWSFVFSPHPPLRDPALACFITTSPASARPLGPPNCLISLPFRSSIWYNRPIFSFDKFSHKAGSPAQVFREGFPCCWGPLPKSFSLFPFISSRMAKHLFISPPASYPCPSGWSRIPILLRVST
jgi:hypothetical protein